MFLFASQQSSLTHVSNFDGASPRRGRQQNGLKNQEQDLPCTFATEVHPLWPTSCPELPTSHPLNWASSD